MEAATRYWIRVTMNFWNSTGMIEHKQLKICRGEIGAAGKGRFGPELGLTHFIDDKDIHFREVYISNKLTRQGKTMAQHWKDTNGQFLHFGKNGVKWPLVKTWKEGRDSCLIIPIKAWTRVTKSLSLAQALKLAWHSIMSGTSDITWIDEARQMPRIFWSNKGT